MGEVADEEDDSRDGEVVLEDVLWASERLAVAGAQEKDGVGHDGDGSQNRNCHQVAERKERTK